MELQAAKQMHVEIEDDLPPFFIAVDYHPETPLVDLLDPGHFPGGGHHGLHVRHSLRVCIHQGGHMALGDNDCMDRGHGMDVFKGQDALGFIDLPTGNLAGRDFTEYASFHTPHLLISMTPLKKVTLIVTQTLHQVRCKPKPGPKYYRNDRIPAPVPDNDP